MSYYYKLSVGFFLLCIGLKIYFDNPIRQIRQRRQGRVSKTGLLGDYLSLFFLTVSNPITVVVFMAVLPECPFSGIFFHAGGVVGGDRGVVRRWRVVVHALDFGKYLS